ncbi:MAG: anaerobic ribonucleoside-triphosphate reductase activating protein [Candidatus Nanoarchaeia archaeon]
MSIRMLPIKGLQKTSLIDFPPYTTSVVFIGGCNFRCKYCHNYDLVLNYKDMPTISENQVIEFLKSKKGWVDAVTITGGEPTLYGELIDFVREIKKLGLKVKLDTNGTNSELLWDMLEEKLLDYIAMDFKAPFDRYENITVFPVNIEELKKSVSLIKNSGVDYEFRATIVPRLHRHEDFREIGQFLTGAKRFVLQPFRGSHGVLDKNFEEETGFSREEVGEIKEILAPYFKEVVVRDES